jgi:hypothetical protein
MPRYSGANMAFVLAISLTLLSTCPAQEVASVDLTKVTARLELRRPKQASTEGKSWGGIEQYDPCLGSANPTGSLRTTLVSLDRTHYQVGDESRFEVTVENVGSTPLKIPFSPHLADLQPEDPARKFAYSELQLTVWIAAGEKWGTNTGGSVTLYGADDHAGTMMQLNPGEWLEIIGKGKFQLPYDGGLDLVRSHSADHVYAEASLYRVESLVTPNAAATVRRGVCLSQTRGQGVPIELTIP